MKNFLLDTFENPHLYTISRMKTFYSFFLILLYYFDSESAGIDGYLKNF